MSWYVEGRRYRTMAEYQRAQADAERRRAGKAAESIAAESRRLQEELGCDREELESAGGDLERQMAINRRVAARVRTLERNRRRIEDLLARTERRMGEGLARMEREMADGKGKLHGVQADLEQLRSSHRRYADELRGNLESVRGELREGLERAAQQRRESEERMKGAVADVDRKLESDRSERARRHAGQSDLAEAEASAAAEAVVRCETVAPPLGLDGELQQLKAKLESARLLVAQGQTSAAVAVSSIARADAEALEREVRGRLGDMDAARGEVGSRVARIEAGVGPAASQDVRDCYVPELHRLHDTLAAVRGRLAKRYHDWRLFAIERREDEELLDEVECETLEIAASAPGVAEAAERRVTQLEEVLNGLEKVYGSMSSATQSFATPDDPKSDLLVDAVFGSSKVGLRLALDGTISLDGYGHGSAGECAAAADRVLEELRGRTLILSAATDDGARQSPQSATESAGRTAMKSGGNV